MMQRQNKELGKGKGSFRDNIARKTLLKWQDLEYLRVKNPSGVINIDEASWEESALGPGEHL